jgi:nitric oxide reductase large subunit
MRTHLATTPRPVPSRTAPALAALLVLGLALPIFLIAGWDVRGWALGALLWAGTRGISMLLAHMRKGADATAASGLLAFELGFKALAVLVVLVALAATEPSLALSATLVFALAYTIELALSLTTYFGSTK